MSIARRAAFIAALALLTCACGSGGGNMAAETTVTDLSPDPMFDAAQNAPETAAHNNTAAAANAVEAAPANASAEAGTPANAAEETEDSESNSQ